MYDHTTFSQNLLLTHFYGMVFFYKYAYKIICCFTVQAVAASKQTTC